MILQWACYMDHPEECLILGAIRSLPNGMSKGKNEIAYGLTPNFDWIFQHEEAT